MKVILSVDALTPQLSGVGRYAWELASRLPDTVGIEQVRFFRDRSWVRNPADLLKETIAKPRRRNWTPRWARDLYWQCAFRGEVFHAPNYFLPPQAQNGVVTVHDLSVFKYPETHPAERVHHFEKSFRHTLAIAGHLITDSETTKQEVIEFFGWPGSRITSVPLGVAHHFSPKSDDELAPAMQRLGLTARGYCLCVSTLEPRKRIDKLLAAYAQLPESVRAVYPLILAGGGGWCNDSLRQNIELGQKAGWLRNLGFVAESDLSLLYAGARLFVYPSIYEGFGLPVAEAMASGVPVVTSACSCLPEVAAGAAKLVNPEDVEGLATVLEESLSDLAWQRDAIANGLKVAARYNWEECVRGTVRVYEASVSAIT